jgi:Galactose oxidase, central domain
VFFALQGWNAHAQSPETFVPTGRMSVPRHHHTATLLKDGRVLITGGMYDPYPSPNPSGLPVDWASAELFDPSTGSFSLTGSMTTRRWNHTATLLQDGRVLIAGGHHYGITSGFESTLLSSAELYDPLTGTFSPTGDMIEAQMSHRATLLSNGKVLIYGGYGRGISSAELYDPAVGMFSKVDIASAFSEAAPLFDGTILIVGDFYRSSAILYDPITNTAESLGSLARPSHLSGHTATLLPTGKVLIAGGDGSDTYDELPLAHAELYDPDTRTFQTTSSLVFPTEYHRAVPLPGGAVLITGGFGCLRCAELFDPYTETFRLTGGRGSLSDDRFGHTATLLADGRVLIAGGYYVSSAEIYIPPLRPILTFERNRVRGGDSYTATFSGSGQTDQTYYDLRFRAPGDSADQVSMNWQRGRSATHNVATGMATGTWTVTGVRTHQDIDDHTGDFASVSVELLVTK